MRTLLLRIFIQATLSLTEFDILFALNLVMLLLNRLNVYLFSHNFTLLHLLLTVSEFLACSCAFMDAVNADYRE